ncbi:MAG: alpha/beta fold hydrolase [Steroidobacteraceae bacterium]
MSSKRTAVVFVHGLWMTGRESVFLRRRLAVDPGYDLHSFRYFSLGAPMAEHVGRLAAFLAQLDAPRVHLVGHSLGGLVIYRLMESGLIADAPRLGRVVFLGTPAVESRTGRRLGSHALGRRLLGHAACSEFLATHQRVWRFAPPLGIVAGDQPIGLGRLISPHATPNDGTVSVAETRLPGATEHIVLPVSHTGMWLSPRVARVLASFLEHGHFGL